MTGTKRKPRRSGASREVLRSYLLASAGFGEVFARGCAPS
jgi:hypothetical protein